MKGRKAIKSSKRCSQNGSYHCSYDGATKIYSQLCQGFKKGTCFLPEIKIKALDRSDITGTFKCLIKEYSEKDDGVNVDHEGLNVFRVYCKAKHSVFKIAKRFLKWDNLSIHNFFTNDDFQTCTRRTYEGVVSLDTRPLQELSRIYCTDYSCFITRISSDKLQ